MASMRSHGGKGGAFDLTGYLPGPVGDTEFLLYQFRSHGSGSPGPSTEGMIEIQGPVPAAVPEPSGLALWSGLGVLGRAARRRLGRA